jgi:hypothetical protein
MQLESWEWISRNQARIDIINPCLVDVIANFLIITLNPSLGVPPSGTISFPFLRSNLASAPLALVIVTLEQFNGATARYQFCVRAIFQLDG